MRKIKFCFADETVFDGFTDDTYWNGFLNVEVEANVFEEIKTYFHDACGYDPEETGLNEVQPDDNGRYSLANGFATSEATDDDQRSAT